MEQGFIERESSFYPLQGLAPPPSSLWTVREVTGSSRWGHQEVLTWTAKGGQKGSEESPAAPASGGQLDFLLFRCLLVPMVSVSIKYNT